MAFLSYILLILSYICIANSAEPLGKYCNNQYYSAKTSELVNTLMGVLVQRAPWTGYSAVISVSGDQIFGLAQCRGDVGTKDCSTCLQYAANEINKLCPYQTDVRIWYDYCFLRHSSVNFIGKLDTGFGIFYYNIENVTDPNSFNEKLGGLMHQIEAQAAVSKNYGHGKGEVKVSPFLDLYALVQCTGDLSHLSCAQCLATAVGNFQKFCDNKKGCRVLYSSCYVRYELYPFFFPLNASHNTSMVMHKYVVPKY